MSKCKIKTIENVKNYVTIMYMFLLSFYILSPNDTTPNTCFII